MRKSPNLGEKSIREPTLYVMSALAGGVTHGYAIIRAVEDLSDGRLRLRAGTLYGALTRLEQEGLIESVGTSQERGPQRRSYRLTKQGRRRLGNEVDRMEANVVMARRQLGHAST